MIGRSIEAQRTVIYRKGAERGIGPGLTLEVVCWTSRGLREDVLRWWYTKEGEYGLELVAQGREFLSGDDMIEQAIEKWKELCAKTW